MSTVPHPAASAIALLTLTPLGDDLFEGPVSDEPWDRVYGGQLLGQAAAAAGHTISSARSMHSTHAYFIRPGRAGVAIKYAVHRLHDGRSFSLRRVAATQGDRLLMEMTVSFHAAEQGWSHAAAMPDVPPPEALSDDRERVFRRLGDIPESFGPAGAFLRPFEFRFVDSPQTAADLPGRKVWLRLGVGIEEDPRRHEALLVYVSDSSLIGAALVGHRRHPSWTGIKGGSLDHAVWLHAPFRIDEWLLYVQESPWTGSGRGFARGLVFSRDGKLIASVAQEALIRPAGARPPHAAPGSE